MPQFSLKRLFVSVTLIAVGCGLIPWARQVAQRSDEIQWEDLLFLVAIFALIGAGVGNFFKHPFIGALLGPPAYVVIAVIVTLIINH